MLFLLQNLEILVKDNCTLFPWGRKLLMDLLLWWIPEDKIQNYSISQKLVKHSCVKLKVPKTQWFHLLSCRLLFSTVFSSPVFKLTYFLGCSVPFCSGCASVYLLPQGSTCPVHYVSSPTKSKDFGFINKGPLISENVKNMHFVFIKLPILLRRRGLFRKWFKIILLSLDLFHLAKKKLEKDLNSSQQLTCVIPTPQSDWGEKISHFNNLCMNKLHYFRVLLFMLIGRRIDWIGVVSLLCVS